MDFYAYGKKALETNIQKYWERYGVDYTSCLEIGCGAGRITMHLADLFKTVHAIDISPGMLSYAKNNIKKDNVNFHLTDGITTPLPEKSVSAVFSIHVFQHFDSHEIQRKNFIEAYRVLQEEGTLFIHLPIYRFPASHFIFRGTYKLWEMIHKIYAFLIRSLLSIGLWKPYMRMIYIQIDDLFKMLSDIGYKDIEVLLIPTEPKFIPFPIVFARK
jgi:ubiquinone/menaquinone biosynthesis C-methylase UbiE